MLPDPHGIGNIEATQLPGRAQGWVDIMYQLMDGTNAVLAGIFFSILIIAGSFFILNLLLAVMENNFDCDHAISLSLS